MRTDTRPCLAKSPIANMTPPPDSLTRCQGQAVLLERLRAGWSGAPCDWWRPDQPRADADDLPGGQPIKEICRNIRRRVQPVQLAANRRWPVAREVTDLRMIDYAAAGRENSHGSRRS